MTDLQARARRVAVVLFMLLAAGPLAAENVRIVQTNSRDQTVSLIDPATQSVVREINGIPIPHGAAAAPDGSRLYFTSEATATLDVVDTNSFEIVKQIPLSARPNNISIGKDGRFIYIGIMDGDGGIDIVDTTVLANVRHIDTGSRVHNTYVTPDGRYFLAGAFGGDHNLLVFDARTEALAWSLFAPRNDSTLEGVRPIAFEVGEDGATKRLFVQVSDYHGFVVVDFAAGREIERIDLPEVPLGERNPGPFNAAPSHGIGVAPDGRTLWVCSRVNSQVYVYSLPDLELLGGVGVGSHPDWVTFSPDSQFVYVANGGSDDVSVIDVAARSEVKRLPVGGAPKRNITAVLR
jgi:YVTN family beta-propeller protein